LQEPKITLSVDMDFFRVKCAFAASAAMLLASVTSVSAQENGKEKSPEEVAQDMVTKMESQLALEDNQIFFVDSILSHDYREWTDEAKAMQASGVQEVSVYTSIKNKWNNQIDSSLKRILTEEQYIGYLKMTGQYKKPKKNKK